MTPLTIFSRVLLPEPLRPISPIDSPWSTVNDTSLTARKESESSCWRIIATLICLRVRW